MINLFGSIRDAASLQTGRSPLQYIISKWFYGITSRNSRMQMRSKNIDSDLNCVTTFDYPVLSQGLFYFMFYLCKLRI